MDRIPERRRVAGNPSLSARFFFSSRRRHTRFDCDWSSDVCSSDLKFGQWAAGLLAEGAAAPGDDPAEGLARCAERLAEAGALARDLAAFIGERSEERRVGKECRSGWPPGRRKKMRWIGSRSDAASPATRLLVRVFFFQAEDGIRDLTVTGVQTCALPI